MKRTSILVFLAFLSTAGFQVRAQGDSSRHPDPAFMDKKQNGEKIFLKHVDRCLSLMEQAAKELQIEGVAVMVFIPGEKTGSGVSKMQVVGQMKRNNVNFLAVANSKIAEMADTYRDSGSKVREPLRGETGWRGGLIKKVDSGYIMGAFSGGTEDQDIVVATAGIQGIFKFLQ